MIKYPLFILSILFISCTTSKINVPEPNMLMANKVQFDAETKEIWAYDFKGKGHYYIEIKNEIIDNLNSSATTVNSRTLKLYCNYHKLEELLLMQEKGVTVYATKTKYISNLNSIDSNQNNSTNSNNTRQGSYCNGYWWNIRSLCQNLPPSKRKAFEKAGVQSASEDT